MSMDETTEHSPAESEILQTLSSGPLSSSLANLSASSRAIPTEKDFHFYYNFDEFKLPIQKIAEKSHSLLEAIGSPDNPVLKDKNKNIRFPADLDIDEAYDWLVNLNDEVLDRFDMSIDEFKKIRDKEEETGRRVSGVDNDDGFQLVQGRKKKGALKAGNGGSVNRSDLVGVKVADNKKAVAVGGKAKVPFHIPTIRKPQEENSILVNNSNLPFEHVWLERSDDGLQFIHPLEKLSVLDFVDSNSGDVEPVSPPPLEHTPFKMVEEVKDLKEMAAKLRSANEFAVDLEHNQYRSFQGLTCLMQISTRTEDFIVDTLKLRIHIGPYLREVFKDPKKKKVMHGADRDIIWLQRDFGIYVCNMFDTGQASRVLKLERNSLEHLLSHFCGITANKEYQNADWRLRPLPKEMVKYAREDTHYLLYIYDLMRALLLSMPNDPENYDPPLVEVYKRSYDVCMQLYEKEVLTESSYLYLYGLNRAGFNAQQLAVGSALFEWRDAVARSEDESTGYILPNKTLLEIAKEMPVTTNKLHRLLKTKHSYIDRNLGTVVGIIRHAMQNSSAFEATAQRLKEELIETAAREEVEVNDEGELVSPDAAKTLENPTPGREGIYHGEASDASVTAKQKATLQLGRKPKVKTGNMTGSRDGKGSFFKSHDKKEVMVGSEGRISERSGGSPVVSQQSKGANTADLSPAPKVSVAAVQVSKKPTGGFASLLGGATSKRKFDIHKKVNEEMKLEKIRSSVNLPFHSFTGANEPPKQVVEERTAVPEFPPEPEEPVSARASKSNLEEIIVLDEDSDVEEMLDDNSETTSSQRDKKCAGSGLGINKEDEPISLTDLSKSFEKCLKSNNQNKKTSKMEKSRDTTAAPQFRPFDYAAAIRFGDGLGKSKARAGKKQNDSAGKKQSAAAAGRGAALINDSTEFRQGRRRLAFPATGNRSATFR